MHALIFFHWILNSLSSLLCRFSICMESNAFEPLPGATHNHTDYKGIFWSVVPSLQALTIGPGMTIRSVLVIANVPFWRWMWMCFCIRACRRCISGIAIKCAFLSQRKNGRNEDNVWKVSGSYLRKHVRGPRYDVYLFIIDCHNAE